MEDDKITINRRNKEYVEKNLALIKVLFPNRFIVVYNQHVEAGFDTYEEASRFGVARFGIDDVFLIYQVEDIKSVNFVFSAFV